MTFTEIQTAICEYCTLTSTEALARVGRAINRHHRRITSELGMESSRFVSRAADMTVGVKTVTFTNIEKIDRIIDVTSTVRLLQETTIHELRSTEPGSGQASFWAPQNSTATAVTALFDATPDVAYSLQADGWTKLSDLSGSDEPVFAASFHDVLTWYVISEELLKKEKDKLSREYERKADKLLNDLKFHYADSPTRDIQQDSSTILMATGSGSSGSGSSGGSGDFLQAGTGAVTRTAQSKMREQVSVKDFGASGGGVVDDAPAFALAIASGAGAIHVPAGSYRLNTLTALTDLEGIHIYGDGIATSLLWGGDATGPMFKLTGCRECVISDMQLSLVSSSFPLVSMIIQEENAGGGTSTMNTYRKLQIDGLGGHMTQGIYLKGDVTDANNDFNNFESLFIGGYTEAGIVLQGANSLHNKIDNCQMAGQNTGKYGVKATSGAGGESGQFAFYHGACLGHTQYDFYVQNISSGGYVLENVRCEGTVKGLFTQGNTGSQCAVSIRNIKWASDAKVGTDAVITIGTPGPVVLENVVLGSTYTSALKIAWSYTAAFFAPSFQARGVKVWGTLNVQTDIFTGTSPTLIQGCHWQTSDTVSGPMHRLTVPNLFPVGGRNAADSADIDLVLLNASNVVTLGDDDAASTLIKGTNNHIIAVDCGVKFPATAVTSTDVNTLDDYQESAAAEYVPAFLGSGGQSGQAYTTQTGWSVKIGKLVYFGGEILLSTLGTITGNVEIALPIGVTDSDNFATVAIWFTSLTTNFESLVGRIGSAGTARMVLYGKLAANTGVTTLAQADLTATSRVTFSGFYKASL